LAGHELRELRFRSAYNPRSGTASADILWLLREALRKATLREGDVAGYCKAPQDAIRGLQGTNDLSFSSRIEDDLAHRAAQSVRSSIGPVLVILLPASRWLAGGRSVLLGTWRWWPTGCLAPDECAIHPRLGCDGSASLGIPEQLSASPFEKTGLAEAWPNTCLMACATCRHHWAPGAIFLFTPC